MDLDEADVVDPHPDIYALFCYYDSLYFDESLGSCTVSWSSSRMTRCAGTCRYLAGGGCEIHLSEPLLKFRPTADLKNTLLHEMIHAFLWMTNKFKDHSHHGQGFQAMMNKINSSSVVDYQKPPGGYNITVCHEFRNEVDSYLVHHWRCETCGDMIKRAMNRQPSASDCIEHVRHDGPCRNPSCHWHNHKILCSGNYVKIAEPPGYKDKNKRKRVKEPASDTSRGFSKVTRQPTQRLCEEGEKKHKSNVKSMNPITNFFSSARNESQNSSAISFPWDGSKNEVQINDMKDIDFMVQILAATPVLPKRRRAPMFRNKRNYAYNQRQKLDAPKGKSIDYSEWNLQAEIESDEEIKPLINKRTDRRKKQKMLENQWRGLSVIEATAGTSPVDASNFNK